MVLLIVGLVLFLGVHSVAIVAPALRARTIRRLGEGAWKGLYALVSLVGFVLICYGFGLARQAPVIVYSPPTWASHVALIVMLPPKVQAVLPPLKMPRPVLSKLPVAPPMAPFRLRLVANVSTRIASWSP